MTFEQSVIFLRTADQVVGFLGEHVPAMTDVGLDEFHHRHFFHRRCPGDPPESWRHAKTDPSDGNPGPIWFEFFWAGRPDQAPELICDHGFMLPRLGDTVELPVVTLRLRSLRAQRSGQAAQAEDTTA